MKVLMIIVSLLTLAQTAFAGGKVIGNGGDPRALEFINSAKIAIEDLKKNEALYPEVKSKDLDAILTGTEVLVSQAPVFSLKGDVRQFSTAINYHDPDTIVVYGPMWSSIKNIQIRKALALHEILSLAGLEETGNYSISKRYLSQLGINCSDGLCETIPRYNCALIKMSHQTNIPEYVAKNRLGFTGYSSEIVDLKSENMKGTITMNTGTSQGFIMLLLYQEGRTVSISELHGAAFPPFIQLKWKDNVANVSWTVSCNQD